MPTRAARPCKVAGCRALGDESGYCPKHQDRKKDGTFADPRRGSRHDRGYGYKWDKQRERILERDNGLCQVCLKRGVLTAAKQVDHVVPKAEGGSDLDENLQSICDNCHKAKTASESRRGRGV